MASAERTPQQLFAQLVLHQFRDAVKVELETGETLPFFTPHGLEHIQGVEERIDYLLDHHGKAGPTLRYQPQELTSLEVLLLRLCAWGHDLGMITTVAEEYQKKQPEKLETEEAKRERQRRDHDRASAFYIRTRIPSCFDAVITGLQSETGGENFKEKLVEKFMKEPAGFERPAIEALLGRLTEEEKRWSNAATELARAVNLIARFHRRAEPIDTCPEERMVLGEPVRTRLLAALFRLADAMQVDSSRFSAEDYNVIGELPEFTEESRLHWIRTVIVSDIRIDLQRFSVHVQADLPLTPMPTGSNEGELNDASLREMLRFIRNDLEEEVLSVSQILVQHHFPPLLGVTDEVHYVPAMEYPEDIRSALHHILAASSPNTSQLNAIFGEALNALLRGAEQRREPSEEQVRFLEDGMRRLIRALGDQLKKRPCHEGLRKIQHLLTVVLELWTRGGLGGRSFQAPHDDRAVDSVPAAVATLGQGLGKAKLLWTLLHSVREVFLEQRRSTKDGVDEDRFTLVSNERPDSERTTSFTALIGNATDIVLYGYSSQLIMLLGKSYDKLRERMPRIHVLECRTKTTYSPSGHLLYLDAVRYVRDLRKVLSKEDVEVMVVPDVALAHILRNPGRFVVLLGSNAVYPNGTFVHSMGHLSVAAVAKSEELKRRCEVIVATDSTKIGKSDPSEKQKKKKIGKQEPSDKEGPPERNRNRWLTHASSTLAELENLKVRLHNWLEDSVPPEYIDKLVVLDKKIVLERTQPPGFKRFDGLGALMFQARQEYCEKLETRLLAATIAHRKANPHIEPEWWRVLEAATFGTERRPERTDDRNWKVAEWVLGYLDRNPPPDGPEAEAAEPSEGKWARWTWTKKHREAARDLREELEKIPEPDQDEEADDGGGDSPAASNTSRVAVAITG